MRNAVYLALMSLKWNGGRALIIVLCLTLTMWLPLTVRLLLNQFQTEITARAASTPLVIGAKGSRIDLTLHALYFQTVPPDTIQAGQAEMIQESGLAVAIPLHIRYQSQGRDGNAGVPIVGTSPEYFEFRRLQIAEGQPFSMLGDCVVGCNAAQRLNLKPGDSILSAPENAFNLAGDYPLKLNVTGVLQKAHSPDDEVIFTDTGTVWIIDGIGHGHQDVLTTTDENLVLNRNQDRVTASAAVLPYTEITPANIDSFHFHGDPETFPLTAVIAVPESEKSRVLLLGRYASSSGEGQCLKPPEVVNDLLSIVFRIEQLVWVSSLVAAVVTFLLLSLVLLLSLRLRAAEIQTMYRIGCHRTTLLMLLGAEIGFLLLTSSAAAVVTAWGVHLVAAELIRSLLF